MAAVDKDLFPEVEGKQSVPTGPTTATTSNAAPDEKVPAFWEHIVHGAVKGMARGKGNWQDAYYSSALGESPPLAMLRAFGLPRGMVDAISPVVLGKMEGSDTYGADKQVKDTSYEPLDKPRSGIAKHFMSAAEGAGEAIMNPIGGPIGKSGATGVKALASGAAHTFGVNAAVGAGARVGSEAGGFVGEGATKVTGIPGLETIGALAGGFGGGYLGTVKGASIKEAPAMVGGAAKRGFDYAANVSKAVGSTIKAKREGDVRGMLDIFFNDYKALDAASDGMATKLVAGNLKRALEGQPNLQAELDEWAATAKVVTGKENLDDYAKLWDTAQRTNNPALAALELERLERPLGTKGATEQFARKKVLQDKLRRIFGLTQKEMTYWAKDPEDALNAFRQNTQAKLNVLDIKQNEIRDGLSNIDATGASYQGKAAKASAEAEESMAKQTADTFYGEARQLGDAAGTQYDLTPTLKKIESVLSGPQGAVGEGAGTTGKRLREYLNKEEIVFGADGDINLFRPLKYSEADSLGKALNRAIKMARGNPNDKMKAMQLIELKKQLNADILAQAPEHVAAARQKADAFWANEYSPRFSEGVNSNLFREGTTANPGMDRYKDIEVFSKWIPESGKVDEATLSKFDDLYGAKFRGEQGRVEPMYQQLGSYVEDLFRRDVLSGKDIDVAKLEKFFGDKGPALERVPGLKDKLSEVAERFQNVASMKELQLQRYKDLTNGQLPLTKDVGSEAARVFIANAMSDPRKMSQFLGEVPYQSKKAIVREVFNSAEVVGPGGAIDADKLTKMLRAGKDPDRVTSKSGFEVLAEATYGKERGAEYVRKLEALAVQAKRENLTNPRFVRPQDDIAVDPIKAATGQSGPSWITQGYAFGSGRVSKAWLAATPISRFLMTKLGNSIAAAEDQLMHTPQGVDILLEMRDKPISQWSPKTLERLDMAKKGTKDLVTRVLNLDDLGYITRASGHRAVVEAAKHAEGDQETKQP